MRQNLKPVPRQKKGKALHEILLLKVSRFGVSHAIEYDWRLRKLHPQKTRCGLPVENVELEVPYCGLKIEA
jgi:hypothetical protein